MGHLYGPLILAAFLSAPAWAENDALKCIHKQLSWHLLHQTPKKTTFPVERVMNPDRLHRTVASVVKSKGKTVQEALEELKVPSYAHRYFGADGRFKYRPEHPIQLSVENGDEELLAAKIHFTAFPDPDNQKVYDLLVKDYLHVLGKMPRVQLLVVFDPVDRHALLPLLKDAPPDVLKRVKNVTIETEQSLNLWSQDGSKPIRFSSGAPLQTLVPKNNRVSPTLAKTWDALEAKGWPAKRSIFQFEGGDVVVGDRHIFVGPGVIEESMSQLKISRAEAIDGLSAEFGKPVFEIKRYEIPSKSQPFLRAPVDFHIDMFLAVARNHISGKETVLLSSPELGLKALAGKRKNSDFSNDWKTMSEQLVRGAKDNPEAPLTDAERALIDTLKKTGSHGLRMQQDHVNAEAVRLRSLGYEVKFVPSITQFDESREEYTWEIFNYTNSIFSGKKAIIPELGIPSLDRAATRVFEKEMGYEVLHVHSPTESLCVHGGIRCMTETYRRKSD